MLGLEVRDGYVLRAEHNVLVHLRPSPVLARVAAASAIPRDTHAHMRNEVCVTRLLADCGAPVVPPTDMIDAGPHVAGRAVVSYWTYVENQSTVDPTRAGRALAQCHALAREADLHLDAPTGSPAFEALNIFAELVDRGVVDSAPGRRVAKWAAEDIEAMEALELREQIIHGDAHLENLLASAAGPLWNDWEDTFRGPLEWDIACLVATARVTGAGRERTESALRGYGLDRIDAVVELLVRVRAFQVATWLIAAAERHGRRADQAEPWLAYVEAHHRRRLVGARLWGRVRRAWRF